MTTAREPVRVLHVDDEPDLAEVAATFLEREDERIAVRSATSAEAGLAALSEGTVDCVVADFDMPGMDGLELLEAVREHYPDLPFILFTGKGSEEVASDAISAGVTDYMQKGTGTDQYAVLANRVVNAVEQHRAEREAEQTRQRLEELSRSIDDCLWMYDADWTELLFISGYEEVWGRPESAVRENPTDFLEGAHPDDRELVDGMMERLSAGESVDEEYRIQTPDGEQRTVWVKGEPVFEDGEVVRVVGFTRDITDRQEQTRRLRTLISNLPGVVYRCRNEPDWPMELLRGSCESLTGYDPEAITDGTVVWGEDILHPEDREEAWERVQAALEADRPFEVTYRARTADGETRWFWERGRAVETETDGTVLEGFITDITDRREYEQELERTTAVLSALVGTLPVGVLVEDSDRNVLATNERLFELFDLAGQPGEVVGADCEQLAREVSDRFAAPGRFVDRIDEVIAADEPVHEEELRLADGRTLLRSYEPVDLPGGSGHLWEYRDITDRKNREERLRETTTQLEALFDQSPDMINVHDGEGNLIDPNPRLVEETGYDEGTLTGMKVWEVDRNIDPDEAHSLWTGMDPGDRRRIEGVYERADGSTFPVEVHIRRIDLDGEDRFIVISRDISERNRRERELERQNERLEEFASIVSHDLRNPLTVAEARLELAQDECDSEHLEDVDRAHDRMNALIDDLLTLAREGEQVGEMETVDLGSLATDCWGNVVTEGSELELNTDARVRADPSRLQQLLENLMRNAVEHGSTSPRSQAPEGAVEYGGPSITVTVGTQEGGFYVEDDGEGIPREEREEVFEAGYSTDRDGTGFGLTIVQQVAEAHGWTVRATEGSEGGARFEITGVEFAAD